MTRRGETIPPDLSRPGKTTMFARALRRRCPACGSGPMFVGWFHMVERCPGCNLRTNRGEQGYTLGALWFNLLMAEGFSMTVFLATVVYTWPNPPWDTLQYLGPIEALVTPFIFWPFARGLFLAFDLCFRPVEERDRV